MMGKFKDFLCRKLGHQPVRHDWNSVSITIRSRNGVCEHIENRWPHFLIQCKRCGAILGQDSFDLTQEIEYDKNLYRDFNAMTDDKGIEFREAFDRLLTAKPQNRI